MTFSPRGTHALRRRCPVCKKLRRFYEPPGGVRAATRGMSKDGLHMIGAKQRACRKGWKKVGGRWVCARCVPKEATP
jgi:hypothetical protein